MIAFGADAMVDTPAGSAPAFTGVSASVDRSGSDLDGALRLASALLPSGGNGGVTVISDGKAALSASTMELMAAAGVRVDVLPLETASGTDAQISELTAPAEVYEGQAVPLSVTIDANADMDGYAGAVSKRRGHRYPRGIAQGGREPLCLFPNGAKDRCGHL